MQVYIYTHISPENPFVYDISFFLAAQTKMKRRRLDINASAGEQFHALRQIPSLKPQQCREIVQLLREDGQNTRIQQRQSKVHRVAAPALVSLTMPTNAEGSTVGLHMFSLPAILQAHVDSNPLFCELLRRACVSHQNELRLIFYVDEVSPGNVLSPLNRRKANLCYISFVEMEVLHLEHLWVLISLQTSERIAEVQGGFPTVVTTLLVTLLNECKDGFAISFLGDNRLIWIKRVVLLADHEGLRAFSGAKGSAGLKPCPKCTNVLSGCKSADGHVNVSHGSLSGCTLQTQEGLRQTLNMLRAQPTKKDLAEMETLSGWNKDALECGPLLNATLSAWLGLEDLTFDAMHQYWSCGIICQELGLWYTSLLDAGLNLDLVRDWVMLGWESISGDSQPKHLFNPKLWRKNADYRGDAAAAAAALSFTHAFSEEILRGIKPNLHPVLDSLQALHAVTTCIQRTKIAVAEGRGLLALQEKHFALHIAAYGCDHARPKWHFAVHCWSQCQRWGRLLDATCCERKHRAYKSGVALNLQWSKDYDKSALLALATQELQQGSPAERLHGLLLGCARPNIDVAAALGVPQETLFSLGLEVGSVSFRKKGFFELAADQAAEIVAACSWAGKKSLVIQTWTRDVSAYPGIARWRLKNPDSFALCPAKLCHKVSCFRFARKDGDRVSLLC